MDVLPRPLSARQRYADLFLCCLIALLCIAKMVPFAPDLPLAGLDGSWRIGLAQAMAQGLAVGRDMVFTFGPYASIYTRNYHPVIDTLTLLSSLYLALSYAATLGLFVSQRSGGSLLALLVVIAGLVYFNDTLLFALPLLVGLQVYLRWPRQAASGATPWLLLLLFTPFGLLPLIKGTLLVLCAMVALLCAGFLAAQRRPFFAVLCILVPSLALPAFWLLAGQPLAALPGYFTSMLAIMSGYNEAMSYYGVLREPVLFVGAALALLWAVVRSAEDGRAKLFLGLLLAGFLFISFKAGFVRQDAHVVIASTALLMAALAMGMVVPARRVMLATLLVLLPWLVIDHHYRQTSPSALARNVGQTVAQAWSGAVQRLRYPDWPRSQFDAVQQNLRVQAGLPVLAGSSDIYSYDQAFLIASGNRWAPRPVMQSYSAYTRTLAEANRIHLLGSAAPENIFFKLQTIDERFPTLDDGVSWPALLGYYRLSSMHNDIAILRRRAQAVPLLGTAQPGGEHRLGETVKVPQGTSLLMVQLDIKPSLVGRLAAMLFRPSRLDITVTLGTSERKKYRLISGMAQAGFLLSPLVEETREFAALYEAGPQVEGKRVNALSVDTAPGFRWFWQPEYQIDYTWLKAAP